MRTETRGSLVLTDGSFRFLLGVNYWPRKLNIRMWRDWDEEALKEDVEVMRSLGVRAVRLFLLDQDWVTASGDLNGVQLQPLRSSASTPSSHNARGPTARPQRGATSCQGRLAILIIANMECFGCITGSRRIIII